MAVRLVYGDPDDLDVDISKVLVCTHTVSQFLDKLDYLVS